MKVFHYADHLKWSQIKNGSWQSDDRPGLGANLCLGRYDNDARNIGAVFALLEPVPESWTSNQYFKDMWRHLKNNVGALLLEIEVDPLKDSNDFVVDSAHIQAFLNYNKEAIPQNYRHENIKAAERAYVLSKIPIGEFLLRQPSLDYALPEVIITENIPFEKISIACDQPLLEERLKDSPEIMDQLERIADLQHWGEQYREKHPELDDLRGLGPERF